MVCSVGVHARTSVGVELHSLSFFCDVYLYLLVLLDMMPDSMYGSSDEVNGGTSREILKNSRFYWDIWQLLFPGPLLIHR